MLMGYHIASADANKGFFLSTRRLKNLLRAGEVKLEPPNISRGMINNQFIENTILSQRYKNEEPYLEPVWETHPYVCQTKDLKTIDCIQRMGCVKNNGLNISLDFCIDTILNAKKLNQRDLESFQYYLRRHVFHLLPKLLLKYINIIPKKFMEEFLMNLGVLVSHGGYATMDRIVWDVFRCIHRDGRYAKIKSYQSGLIKRDLNVKFKGQKGAKKFIGISDLILGGQINWQNMLKNMFPNLCNTNWKTIRSIKKGEKTRVYDIEVQDTHCFFANGILVHNCHHASARTSKEVLLASPDAYWRFGGSATPHRETGDDIMLQAIFGSKIVSINASYLIERGWLVKPYIFFENVPGTTNLHSYPKIYEQCVVKNDAFNNHVADTANHMISRGLSTLVLVRQYAQGDYLKKLIPDSEFLTGRTTSEKRTEIIEKLRKKEIRCMIATSLADEGLDIPTLDAVLIPGGGKSSTRLFQRIGRTLRKDKKRNDKDKALVIVYCHNVKYLDRHAKKVRALLKREPRFVLLNSKGANYIRGEIDDVLGVKNNVSNLFNG